MGTSPALAVPDRADRNAPSKQNLGAPTPCNEKAYLESLGHGARTPDCRLGSLKFAPTRSRGQRAQEAQSEAAQVGAAPATLSDTRSARVSNSAGESEKAFCGTRGAKHLLGPRTKRVVGLSGGPTLLGVAGSLEGFLGW